VTPELSVVVPCHNEAALIGDTVRSVLALAEGAAISLEIIVVDDGSTDGTRAVVESMPVRLVAQRHRGVSGARNNGIAHARAPVIAMLDADDRWTSAVFDVLVPAIMSEGATGIVQGRIRDDWPGVGLGAPYCGCNLGSALLRREVVDEIGPFDESLTRFEDLEWLVRAYDKRLPKDRVPDPVLHYRRRAGGLTASAPRLDPRLVRVMRDIARRRQTTDIPRPSGFPSASEYLGVVPPESERRP